VTTNFENEMAVKSHSSLEMPLNILEESSAQLAKSSVSSLETWANKGIL